MGAVKTIAGSSESDQWPPGSVLVVVATYRERDIIASLAEAVLSVDPALQLLVVDDESPDGTGEIVRRECGRNSRLHLLVRHGRRGLGGAVLEGFREARRRGFEVAVNMDADFSHDPIDIPRLLAAMDPAGGRPADMVVGSRKVAGGGVVGWPIWRHAASRAVCWYTRWVLRVPVRDASSGFRAVRLSVLDRTDGHFSEGYAFFEHLAWSVHRAGGMTVEVPITFTNRKLGKSKASPAAVVRGVADLLRLTAFTWLRPGRRGFPTRG